ncbi:putative exopolygalacturonase X [Pestalotiopsis fici W106-1]|uniref:galacturonan 1,4-alpha-galacturonidase n=1 Tax=Pestalotiopsis fici (strain W106-1 / CGMCC3.15140) TaxID=1229662 RepID=W3WXD4_PESFW|nr:putative exopolygalacturonase X [Pestalotiopsis fici W106-1]ETS78459.1 putative exopolygalacturonase X [Pestalotiopsis fici W106-1]
MLSTALTTLALAALTTSAQAASKIGSLSPNTGKTSISRPNVQPYPHNTGRAAVVSPERETECFVVPTGGDDSEVFLSALQECNGGGKVVLDSNYTIGSVLDLTFLDSVDIAISGKITFTDDIDYWVNNYWKYDFQNSTSFFKLGGKDVNIYGDGVGVIDGAGQAWWEAFATNASLLRPILFVTDGLEGGSITGLNLVNSPNWFNLIANTSDVLISDITISVYSTSSTTPKNTDGWDTYRADGIVIQNSVINNGDDCVSFKPNSTNIVVQGLTCNGSHGISVGSLGQYVEQYDIVENIYVFNNSMSNASDGARIKVWPGINSYQAPTLSGGGGAGYVKNITYQQYYNDNNDWAIEVNQCYGQSNKTLCELFPSNMTISDVYFLDFWGTTSSKHDPQVGTLVCSSEKQCQNIVAKNISITPPSGDAPQWICSGFDTSGLEGFDCVSS